MTAYIKYGLIALAVAAVYSAGYYRAEAEGELVLESLKLEHAKAIIEAQENEKAKWNYFSCFNHYNNCNDNISGCCSSNIK